eukprot:996255-Pleurochrysis_carterae.AAC.1
MFISDCRQQSTTASDYSATFSVSKHDLAISHMKSRKCQLRAPPRATPCATRLVCSVGADDEHVLAFGRAVAAELL